MAVLEPELISIRDLIYTYTGIYVRESRMNSLARSVNKRRQVLNLRTARDYCRYLLFDATRMELEKLIEQVVVPETHFFRDYPQLKTFAEGVLPRVAERKREQKDLRLSLLSAGCATGEEPYTLAIILREMLNDFSDWEIQIDAVDISAQQVAQAKMAEYSSRSLREMPYLYRDTYFTQQGGSYLLDRKVAGMVTLRKLNLFDRVQMASLDSYDVVFCRNVLIYLNQQSAATVLEYLHLLMNPGAHIFLGAAESVGRLTHIFEIEQIGRSFVYHR